MSDYEEKMLVLLVEKYRKSKKDAGTSRIQRRTQIKPTELYKGYKRNDGDLEQIEAVNHAAEVCREKGFLTYEMNGFSNEILTIYLVDAAICVVERYLGETYGYESKADRMRYVEAMIGRYGGLTPVAERECEKLRACLEKNVVPKHYLEMEDVLKALVFIEKNEQMLYIREASSLIFGTSKYLEENCLESVSRLIRDFLKRPCEEDEMPDEILGEYGIVKEKQKICLKGDITIAKSGKKLEVGAFCDGIEFYADELEEMEQVVVHTPKLITVENRTAYLRSQAGDTSYFYLGGYANRFQRDFLKRIFVDNPEREYRHFGDIDAGGFYIHEHLCRVTGIPFALEHMSVGELKNVRYQSCLQRLTANDRKRLQSLANQEEYREVAEYMLEHDVKLEQEIVALL